MVNSGLSEATLPRTPALVVGWVRHTRREKMNRKFQHKTYQWLVDLDALPNFPWYLKPFTGFSAGDHLGDPTRSIKENVEHFLELNDVTLVPSARILMLANARILGYTFDPLSVFWYLDAKGTPICVLAEVRNTYGQRHLYLLHPDSSGSAETQKMFHVSPFLDVSGQYEMRFTLTPQAISTSVTLFREGAVAFAAVFFGAPIPATRRAIFTQLILKPFMTQRISALIRIHGIWLWLRRLPVFQLPKHDVQKGA